jgi:hypothetical protein
VAVVDVVTRSHHNLHNDLMARLRQPGGPAADPLPGHLYATAYRATGADGAGELSVWVRPLAVGQPLPTLPLWLLGGVCVPARLGDAYEDTCGLLGLADRLGPT